MMAAARSRWLREKLLDVRAAGASASSAAMGAPGEARRFFSVRSSLDRAARQISINLGMRVSSVSILEVYPRTLESAFSRILVSRNSGRRRLRMPSNSGDSPNGSPVHRIQGVSKMYKDQYDLMPLGCAIDEARRIEGLPVDVKMSTAMLDEAEKHRGAERFWLVQSPRRHLPGYLAQRIGRMTSANHEIASSRAKVHGAVQARSAALRRVMAAHFSIDQRFDD
ncbi:NodY protein [Bradyrhizobium shewense]|uniref:NodY protein n=2 Tax=Bradyrhizobium shewense TaxID=1761772 RepID=A0A1C3XT22_9BRAD|nr:NodY protein [Bradyrhizobium shewense]